MSEGRCSSAVCVVYERRGFWAVRLRQLLRSDGVRVRSGGSLAQCLPNLEKFPSSMVLLEPDEAELDTVFELLHRIQSRFSRARSLVVLPRSCRQQWWLREAGAIHVAESSRELASVARLVRRHVRQAPAAPMTWAEQVYAGLPWSSERPRSDK